MTFEIAATYGVVAAVTIVLRWMASRNRQSGWQRERNDLLLENLMTWAAAQVVMRKPQAQAQTVVRPVTAAPPPVYLTGQLLSLQNALNTNAGMRCQPRTADTVEASSHDISLLSK